MVSTITALMIQGNDVQIFDTPERVEAWILHDGEPHALVLSCAHEHRAGLENLIAEIKAAP